ncbi:hypothetical protein ABH944_003741 [Caballeronia udeis]|uniref:Transposase n=1 Tax=Caballeronia udeis TaxID=1232866 RepID=A0ABW8MKY9_9BURK
MKPACEMSRSVSRKRFDSPRTGLRTVALANGSLNSRSAAVARFPTKVKHHKGRQGSAKGHLSGTCEWALMDGFLLSLNGAPYMRVA